jgi:Recombination directionality factor-like
MITRDVPRKLSELGRIRIGNREPNKSGRGTHPHKLAHFRFTSSNRSLLHFAAQAYGGEVEPWDDEWAPHDEDGRPTQYELYTTADALQVLIPTMSAVSLSFEQWSASGCQRRCTGAMIVSCPLQESLEGTACTCPEDDQERARLAADGQACFRILRLNVLLPDLPGAGVWRLETKGFFATAELLGTLDMLQMAGKEHTIIEAVLRLEQRTVKRVGKGEGKGTLQFAVPVLWPTFTPRQLLAGASQVLLTPPPRPATPPALAQHVADLCGDEAALSLAASAYMPQIEAAILANEGQVEPWYVWAERRFTKKRTEFAADDWRVFLEKVREQSQKRAENGPGSTTSHATGASVPADVPGAEATPEPPVWPNEDLGD